MKPPFQITPKILDLCSEISRVLGQYEGIHLSKPEPKLRKINRIRTIHASLAIEGNTLALDQITAIMDGKRVKGPGREILEVQNAIRAYDEISRFKIHSSKSLREAHGILMKGLVTEPGKWRTQNVGIFQGKNVTHAAPQAKRVPELMDQLFSFIKIEKTIHPLILSAIFHYELEFIHPFLDGNGRIGRLWQTVMLTQFHPIFEFTPIETSVHEHQLDYYRALGVSDKLGQATPFIEFSLTMIQEALLSMKDLHRSEPLTAEARLQLASSHVGTKYFSRKDYLLFFKTISTATASRDLALGVEQKIISKTGDKSLAKYRFK